MFLVGHGPIKFIPGPAEVNKMLVQSPELVFAFSALLGTLFLVGAFLKLYKFKNFKTLIRSYRIVPSKMVGLVAYAIPVSESVVGLLLFSFLAPKLVLAASLVMVGFYTVAIAHVMVNGLRMSNCGCLGASVQVKPDLGKVALNLLTIAVGLVILI